MITRVHGRGLERVETVRTRRQLWRGWLRADVLHEDENELRPQCSPGVATFRTFDNGLRGVLPECRADMRSL